MTTETARPSPLQRVSRILLSDYFVLYLSLAYVAALAPFYPVLLTPANISNVLSNMWPLLIVATGQTFVLAIAGIDLSQGAVIAVTSVICAMLIAVTGNEAVLGNAPIWGAVIDGDGGLLSGVTGGLAIAILAMVVAAALIGLLNGVAVAVFGMPAFMVTLVTMLVVSAFAIYLSMSENISGLPEAFIDLGKGDLVSVYFGAQEESKIPRKVIYSFVTYPMVIAIAVAVFAHYLLNRTVFGRYVFAIGSNIRNAQISGVPVRRIVVAIFVISAVCAAIASILYSARLEAGRPTLGAGTFLLDVIGATVIGGTSLFGGKAKIIWTFFGVLFFVLLSNTLNLMNLSAFQVDMVKGAVILAAALLDVLRTRITRETAR
ncbi:ABC transporter permease [Bauldia litoralis]|uniref:Ribose transport system permease protein n=1 Tax=Bauldia litoralis TaxID=665467 RepID=A0A1G6CWQ8_9HYPH|nr:ABC transporter permease [Bauldia litoralis]SDB37316.1 ribose transport system permease protein [Bauldia litoralis]